MRMETWAAFRIHSRLQLRDVVPGTATCLISWTSKLQAQGVQH
jgi:hypothetical protein